MRRAPDRPGPAFLPLIVETLPLADLAPYRQFVTWHPAWRASAHGMPGRWTKPPTNPHTGDRAEDGDPGRPDTWGSWDEVVPRYDRVGFVPTRHDPFTVLDVDTSVTPARELKPWAHAIVDRFPQAYWEYSPSGTGLKGFVRGHVPEYTVVAIGDGQLEVFSCGKFSTLTGHRLPGSAPTIGDGQAALAALMTALTAWDVWPDLQRPGGTR
jgi:primase-polymerase (primpol)-like protein